MRIKAIAECRFEYAADPHEYLTRGVNPHDAFETGLALSSYWQVFADGEKVTTFDTPITHSGPHSFAVLPEGAREIRAVYHTAVRTAEVLPERPGITPTVNENEISFDIGTARNVLIETNGTACRPLSLFAAKACELPDPDDENVLWFEPGLHRIKTLELKSGQTLYLSSGAVLVPEQPVADELVEESDWAGKPVYRDFICAENATNVKVCGNGIIDLTALDWHARRTLVFTSCENVKVSDIIMVGACSWTMPFYGCNNVHVDGIRMLGYRENSDGIDLVDTHNAVVENCFIRTGDDAICMKSMSFTPRVETHDILVKNCCVWNDKVRAFGVAGETRHNVYNAVFEHCDVLHSFADWTTEVCALGVYICDAAEISNITFKDIVIRQESNHAVCCCIVKDKWSTDEGAGQIHDVLFEEIDFPEDFTVFLSGYDNEHKLKNISFKNCTVCGKPIAEMEKYIETKKYVE